MKIILSHGYFLKEDPRELEIMKPYVPLGILYISAWLEKNGFENDVYDSTFSSFEKFCENLLTKKPQLLCLYTNLMTKLNILKIIDFVKNEPLLSNTKIILGGPEVRNHDEAFLNYGAHIIVVGEGEQTMLDICLHFIDGQFNISEIESICYKEDGKIIRTKERSKIRSIDELPFPNRHKVDLQKYFDAWKSKHGTSSISLSTMRGCPYTCNWCSRAVYGQSYRRRSPKLVVDEIIDVQKNYQFDSIWFVDDVFTISHKWLAEFNHEINSRQVKINFECITRADRLTDEALLMLKESGCVRVWIGTESGSQKIIDAMDRRVDVKQVRRMLIAAKKMGIQTGTFIMVGYPGENIEDIEETIKHLTESDPDLYTITIAYPIKGTQLYNQTESNFINQQPWHNSTDRQIDFKRTHHKKFYEMAIRLIYNEVKLHKLKKENLGQTKNMMVTYAKIKAARLLMKTYQLF